VIEPSEEQRSGDEPDDPRSTWISVPGGRRTLADEWALVLASQGIASGIRPGAGGLVLEIDAADRVRAVATLEAYWRENPSAGPDAEPDQDGRAQMGADHEHGPEADHPGEPAAAGLAFALGLIAVHLAIGDRRQGHPLMTLGSADAALILDGEWWRGVTALCLHADIAHVLGNALFGFYFVTAVCRALGSGLGLTLVLAAGAGGNWLNAVSYGRFHDSVGASTAVFGAIGVLAGLALAQRRRQGVRGRRLIVPIGAGLGLLAMLGTTGARVDIWAHFYGLFVGAALGLAAGLLRIRPSSAWQQWLIGGASALFLALSWGMALR